MTWTEEAIREELRKLDDITGLHGSRLPILFTKAKRTLGSFYHDAEKPLNFRFSSVWLTDPNFAHAQGIDLIRHEYAHYMDFMRNGKSSHGPKWKACCREIGAEPSAHYNAETNRYQLSLERAACEQEAALARYTPGTHVTHPAFGTGVVESCTGSGASSRIAVRFATGTKLLGAAWVIANCAPVGNEACA